jgi:protein involved in polysaccharide export with SLBB domain
MTPLPQMTLKDFDKVFLTGTHHHCKNQPRRFPAHSGGKMLNYLLDKVVLTISAKDSNPPPGLVRVGKAAFCALAMLAVATACETAPPPHTTAPHTTAAAAGNVSTNAGKSLMLQEGDTIKIAFPGAPTLDTVEVIRRDGMITLDAIGEYEAAGKTPAAMESELKRLYGSQLVNSKVTVTVQSSAFVVYVMGAVNRPGKVASDRPLTVLQALIEAGVDDTKSNMKSIQIIRTDDAGRTEKFKLNLYKVFHSKTENMPSFTLKPYDVINVSERFSFF